MNIEELIESEMESTQKCIICDTIPEEHRIPVEARVAANTRGPQGFTRTSAARVWRKAGYDVSTNTAFRHFDRGHAVSPENG